MEKYSDIEMSLVTPGRKVTFDGTEEVYGAD